MSGFDLDATWRVTEGSQTFAIRAIAEAEKAIGAGRMDRRLELYAPVEVVDDVGGQAITWELQREVWASREDVSGREQMRAGGLEAEQIRRYTIRSPSSRRAPFLELTVSSLDRTGAA